MGVFVTLCGCFTVLVRETVAEDYELDFSMVRFPKFEPTYFELYSKVFLILVSCYSYLSYAYVNKQSKQDSVALCAAFI